MQFRGFPDDVVRADIDWSEATKRMLKAEIKRHGWTYEDMSRELAAIGIIESEANIRNKISRGHFSAVFFVQCLAAMRCAYIDMTLLYRDRNLNNPARIVGTGEF